ncbi:zinc-finger [Saccharopolyspora antimicrobica]|uniref:Zinc finger protein n=1 Tax=Saccharopolyspora antimicrobica TaxID=455193 RepID=A0A1I5IQ21_9PSEU|nr:zinc finger protein [Saccharopolyspora antimicrobica]RKT84092.1 zinc finger protein [Saccharopolyspora antimicrobica]SFO62420.1 zinc-finger [Saccharopolyspora antimicrobica]
MHPFHWVPGEGERHASLDSRPGGGYPTGMGVTTLCGKELLADNSEFGWLWSTCRACNAEAHRIAGSTPAPRSGSTRKAVT